MLAKRSALPASSTPCRPSIDDFWRHWLAQRDYFRYMCIRWLGRNRHEAEEVLSCGQLRAFDYLQNHPGSVEKFRPWALQMLRNLCIDSVRAAGRRVASDLAAPAAEPSCRDALPDRNVYRGELRAVLAGAIAGLPPRLQSVLTLRLVEDLEYEAISVQLGITRENARKRLQEARAHLREQLARAT